VKILLFTDLHYYGGDNPRFDTSKKLVKYALPMLDEFIKIAEDENIDFVVNLGDIIQDTYDKEKDIECLTFMFEKLKGFGCPCYSVLGNHDMKMMDSEKEVEAIMGYESNYSFDKDGFHFVFLTTDVRPELGIDRGGIFKTQTLPEKTVKWLENDLDKNTLPCIIFTHFVLCEVESVPDPCMFLKNRAEVKAILDKHDNIKAVFNGHQHIPKIREENGLTYYVVGSPTASPDADGIPLGIYIIIETAGDAIDVHINKVELDLTE